VRDGQTDLAAGARAIIDSNLYMSLGTADEEGRPWVTPVYFAVTDYTEFVWVSQPDARHSQNIAARPQVAIVIFDSQVPINTGEAVYMSAVAEQLSGDDVTPAIDTFSARGVRHGGQPWTADDVGPTARHRLYRAAASEHFVLNERDERVAVRPAARRRRVM
jgi:hypothetical protein